MQIMRGAHTDYNEDGNFVIRVLLDHDEDFYSIVDAAKRNSPLSTVRNMESDWFRVYAEKEQDKSFWYLRIQAPNGTYADMKSVYIRQSLSIDASAQLDKLVFERPLPENLYTIGYKKAAILNIVAGLYENECKKFHDYNGFELSIGYNAEAETYSLEAERMDFSHSSFDLDIDELDENLSKIGRIDELKGHKFIFHANKSFSCKGYDFDKDRNYLFETLDFRHFKITDPENDTGPFEVDKSIFLEAEHGLVMIEATETAATYFAEAFKNDAIEEIYGDIGVKYSLFHRVPDGEETLEGFYSAGWSKDDNDEKLGICHYGENLYLIDGDNSCFFYELLYDFEEQYLIYAKRLYGDRTEEAVFSEAQLEEIDNNAKEYIDAEKDDKVQAIINGKALLEWGGNCYECIGKESGKYIFQDVSSDYSIKLSSNLIKAKGEAYPRIKNKENIMEKQ